MQPIAPEEENPYFIHLKKLKNQYLENQSNLIIQAIKSGFPLTAEEIKELVI